MRVPRARRGRRDLDARNRSAFERIRLRPRTLVDVSGRSQQVTLFGKTYTAPFGVAPTGAAGLYWHDADVALARAAAAAGVPFVLSTASFVEMERVAREAGGTKWFQLYASKDRAASERLVTRARDSGYEALVVTTDVCVGANRQYNLRNGFEIPFRLNMANVVQGALHPRWLVNVFLRTLITSGMPRFRNVDTNGADMVSTGRATLYGAAAAGEAGALRAIDILKSEVDRVMALLGARTVAELTRDHLVMPENAA
ncbi:MAG TPA: alpha-hydroxy acid oxidase [Burkholderiales bacterium]|nr:alpha-hydroxy acid oxidase [Burkholderiales bacterium]